MRIRQLAVGVAAASVVAVAGASPAWAASTASLHIGSSGEIVAKGAAAKVVLNYTCPSGYTGDVSAYLSQVTRSRLTNTGGAGKSITCTGSSQTVTLYVTGTYAWKRGDAVANGYLSACAPDYSNCVNISTSKVITLR